MVIVTVHLEPHSFSIRSTGPGSNLRQPYVLKLVHRVLGRQIAQAHVRDQSCVLHRACQEIQNRTVTANQLVQVWLLGNAANPNGCFTTDGKQRYAVLFPVEGNVIILLGQSCCVRLRYGPRLLEKANHVAVVLVVHIAGLLEVLLQPGRSADACHSAVKLRLCQRITKVQRSKPLVLGADASQIHCEQAVGCVWTASGGLLQDVHNLLDVGPVHALDNVLCAPVWTLLGNPLNSPIGNRLRGEVHPLVVHPQVVHHLRTLERFHPLRQTLQWCKPIYKHRFRT